METWMGNSGPRRHKIEAKLNWSLNVSQTDDALYTLPRPTSSSMRLAKDQWCTVPTYSLQSGQAWTKGRSIEANLFLSSAANNSIELVCHDPLHERTSSYQVETNSEVLKTQILPLPAGVEQQATQQDEHSFETFGILLLLATIEGVSAFSMVFNRNYNEYSFTLEECSELSNSELQDINTPLSGRKVQAIQSKIVTGPISDEKISSKKDKQQTQTYLVLAVASSTKDTKSPFPQKPASSQNVDAFLFPLVDHFCPVFRYRKRTRSDSVELGVPSLAYFQSLLKGVGRVKNLELGGGDNILGEVNHCFLVVLLTGELKLVPLPSLLRFQGTLNSHKIKVHTVLLSGMCAHPSMKDLGEAVLLEPNQGSNNIAVLCKPKIDEIGFKAPSPSDLVFSSRKTVSFSPVESVNEFTPANPARAKAQLFREVGDAPYLPQSEGPMQTPKHHDLDESQIVTPESDNQGETLTPKKSNVSQLTSDSYVSQMTSASSLVGLKLIDDESLDGTPRSQQVDDAPEKQYGVSSTSEGSAEIPRANLSKASLVGLDLVDSQSISSDKRDSRAINTSDDSSQDILDLTGKWSNLNTDECMPGLSPLSGIILNSSADEDFTETNYGLDQLAVTPRRSGVSMQTPNKVQKGRFGTGSALKKIQCTTPARQSRRESVANAHEELSHVVIITVEQTISKTDVKNDNKMQLKVSHSSVALPLNFSCFKTASLKWEALGGDGFSENLLVATNDPSTDMSKVNVATLAMARNGSLQVSELNLCDLTQIFNNLQRPAQNRKYVYGIRSISLVETQAENISSDDDANPLGIRFLISTALRDGSEKDRRGTIAPKTPINNMSLTEDTRVTVACATLLTRQSQATRDCLQPGSLNTVSKSTAPDERAQTTAKLEEVMSFLQTFKEQANTRLDAMDERLGNIEEALRTV